MATHLAAVGRAVTGPPASVGREIERKGLPETTPLPKCAGVSRPDATRYPGPGFKFPRRQGRVMSTETNQEDDGGADDRDRQVFRRLGIMTIVWVILLVVAGLLLLFYGGFLTDLVV